MADYFWTFSSDLPFLTWNLFWKQCSDDQITLAELENAQIGLAHVNVLAACYLQTIDSAFPIPFP